MLLSLFSRREPIQCSFQLAVVVDRSERSFEKIHHRVLGQFSGGRRGDRRACHALRPRLAESLQHAALILAPLIAGAVTAARLLLNRSLIRAGQPLFFFEPAAGSTIEAVSSLNSTAPPFTAEPTPSASFSFTSEGAGVLDGPANASAYACARSAATGEIRRSSRASGLRFTSPSCATRS